MVIDILSQFPVALKQNIFCEKIFYFGISLPYTGFFPQSVV